MKTNNMHHAHILTLLTLLLLRTTTAFVPFAHSLHPDIDMATVSLPLSLSLPTPNPTPSPASTASSSLSDPTPSSQPSPPPQHTHPDLRRQLAPVVTAPAAVLPLNPDQISPITTVEVDSYPPGGGAPVKMQVAYTQTFVDVPEQWEAAGAGSIGMGTIVGEVGRVRTKRFVPFKVEEVATVTASSFVA